MDLGRLAIVLGAASLEIEHMSHANMEKACKLLEDEAKHVIGTYEYGWPQLAESTQAQRVSLGYSANEPLLRTGELRQSITHNVDDDGRDAYVGTDDPIAKYQEFGTSKIPPRSFLGGALHVKEEEMKAIFGFGALKALETK